MKEKLISLLMCVGFITSLNAYELNGDLDVKWTGYKTEAKAPVSGGFNTVKFDITSSDNLSDFLKSSKVTIDSRSLESKNAFRNNNIISTLFSLASSETIEGSISKVDEKNKTLVLDVTMNNITKNVPMNYELLNGKIIAKGSIDILDYNLKDSYLAYAKKCASFHQNKSFSDVGIEFSIPFK